MLHADNAYWIPAIRIESHRLRTNTQSNTAFRGFGGPQGMVGIERLMDHVAHAVGRDPVEVRRLNYYRAAEASGPGTGHRYGGPHSPKPTEISPQTTPYHQPVEDFILHEMTDRLLATSDYHARRGAIAAWNAKNPVLKRGIAFNPVKFGISFTLTHLNQAGALVHVYQDGSIHMNHGGTEMGQGLFQKVAQVAASRFGVSVDKVKITATDTGKVPNTSATAASSGTDLNGMAVKAACDTIRDRMAEFIAERHQADAECALRPVGGLATRLGQLELDSAAIGRHGTPLDQPGLLEAVHQRGERRPAHPDRGGELAGSLRTFGRRDEQPVLRQADARGLAGLLRHTREAREEPDAFPEIVPLLRDFESGRIGNSRRAHVHGRASRSVGTV
jgi:xanthine dehydrogenase large subunit